MTALLAEAIPPCSFSSTTDVQAACDQVRARLDAAAAAEDIPAISICRAAAEDIRVAVRDGHLGSGARLAAAELQRRGDRAIGIAIRRGQESGEIRHAGRFSPETAGKPIASDFVSKNDLYRGGNGRSAGVYDLTDGVTDEDFEAALAASRAAGSLSRVDVARRLGAGLHEAGRSYDAPSPGDRTGPAVTRRLDVIREMAGDGHTSRQIADLIGRSPEYIRDLARRNQIIIRGDEVTAKSHPHDSSQIVQGTVAALEGLAMGVGFVNPADLDPALIEGWVTSFTQSIRAINRLKRDLQKVKEINP